MLNILSWYNPISTRSIQFDNFWRQSLFIASLFLLSYIIWSLNTTAFELTRDYFIKAYGTYERKIATSVSVIFQITGAALCLYASWLICWSSRQQMKTQNFGKIPEVIMWILLLLQAIVATKSNFSGQGYFSTLNITIPIASIFALILLINGFLLKQGINLSLKKRTAELK